MKADDWFRYGHVVGGRRMIAVLRVPKDRIYHGFPRKEHWHYVSRDADMRYFDIFWVRKHRTIIHRPLNASWRLA